MKKCALISLFLAAAVSMHAQSDFAGRVRLDRMVHDFGDLTTGSGPVSCSFNVTNISESEDLLITSVVSSCGCTNVKWTRQTIAPGKTGTIEATYSNDEGPYPFDKTLTAYFGGVRRPVVLHLRGVVNAKKVPLAEAYPVHMGAIGLKDSMIKGGNLQQGESRSGEFTVANLGRKAVSLGFAKLSDGLTLEAAGPIPAGGTGKVGYTIRSDRSRWGTNIYRADITVSDKTQGTLEIKAVTKENFSSWSPERRKNAARPSFAESTWSFNPTKAGTRLEAAFKCVNEGGEDLIIYKMESDSPALSLPSLPVPLSAGKRMTLKVGVDTSGLPAGEQLYMLTLYTNSPLRPVVNLFVAGFLK